MESNYGEFQGTDLDPSVDYEFDDDFDDEGNDLLPILGASALIAAVVGGVLVVVGRRRNLTPEEHIQEIVKQLEKRGGAGARYLEKRGRKGARAVERTVADAKLGDLLDDALTYSRHRAADIGHAYDDSKVSDTLEEALGKARKAASRLDLQDAADLSKSVRKSVRRGVKQATHDLDLGNSVDNALSRARKAAGRLDAGALAQDARKRAGDVVDNVRDSDLDAKGTLDNIRERVTHAVGSVLDDLAPKAMDTAQGAVGSVGRSVREDVLPAAQDAFGRVRADVIPAAQERVSKMLDQSGLDDRARKAGGSARKGVESLSDLIRGVGAAVLGKVMDELLPQAQKMGGKAVDTARDDVIPAVADTAGEMAHRLKEDVLPRVGAAAEKTPDVISDLLQMARERVDEVMEKAQPAAADAVEFSRHRASDVAESLRDSRNGLGGAISSVGGGVGGALSSAGQGVKGAVGTAVDATTHTTKQLTAILFWLAMLGGLILLVFVPDRDKQREMWNGVNGFLGELREMWRDLQGEDYELEAPEDVR